MRTMPYSPTAQSLESQSHPLLTDIPEGAVDNLQDTFVQWTGVPGDTGSEYMIPIAWRTQADGYLNAGLAKPAAIQEGILAPTIDKSRHITEGVQYFLRYLPEDADFRDMTPADEALSQVKRSTARVIDAVDMEHLPTYPLTKEGIGSEGRARLTDLFAQGYDVKEIGALANSHPGYSRGASEVIRDLLVATAGKDTRLFISMADRALKRLSHSLGPDNLQSIGEPVTLEENKYRNETVLHPIIINPDALVTNLFNAFLAERNTRRGQTYLQSALFFAEPLAEHLVPEPVADIRATLGRSTLRQV